MAASKTYYVGNASQIKRSSDLGASWQDISSAFASSYGIGIELFDIMTVPQNKDYVWVTGVSNVGSGSVQSFTGIAYSTNAGQNWITPGMPASAPTTSPNYIREVWVTDASTVYACGNQGFVYKCTNANTLTPSFSVTASRPSTTQNCWSIHFPTPNNGVVGLETGVFYTSDGGTTWIPADPTTLTSLNGRYYSGIYYHIDPNPQNSFIVAVCDKYIVRWAYDPSLSTYKFTKRYDFGVFMNQPFNPDGNGIHLTWHIDYSGNLYMWATGANDQVLYSSDKGITWTGVNNHVYKPNPVSGNPIYPIYSAAHFYKPDEGFLGHYFNNPSYPSLATIDKYVATAESISNLNNFAKSIGAIWTELDPEVYRLDDCEGTYVTVYTDQIKSPVLQQYVGTGQSIYAPTIIFPNGNVSTPPKCFTVSISVPVQNLSTITLSSNPCVWDTCEECVPKCYFLENCNDETDTRIIQIGACNPNAAQLEEGIYKVISSEEYCRGTCFKLSPCICGTPPCKGVYTDFPDYLIQIDSYVNCNQCKGLPEQLNLRPRSVKPGFYTPGCPPDYTVKTSCMYAEQVYDEMVAVRYGITICCDHDVDRWDIKMQLLQLAAIYDPDLCNPPTPPVDPCQNV